MLLMYTTETVGQGTISELRNLKLIKTKVCAYEQDV